MKCIVIKFPCIKKRDVRENDIMYDNYCVVLKIYFWFDVYNHRLLKKVKEIEKIKKEPIPHGVLKHRLTFVIGWE